MRSLLLAACLLTPLAGCGCEQERSEPAPLDSGAPEDSPQDTGDSAEPEDPPQDTDDSGEDPPVDTGDSGEPEPWLNVEESEDIGLAWDCPEDYRDCVEDYLAFIDLAEHWWRPISEKDLEIQLAAIAADEVQVHEESMSHEEVAALVGEALNMDFLLEGLDERLLQVTVVRRYELANYIEQHMLLEDPWIGTFYAVLLLPYLEKDEAAPAIMPLAGHSQRAESTLDFMFGREYPLYGYAVLGVTFRVSGADEYEDLVTRELLLAGFSFESIRLYESLLALKYLRWRADVDQDRIGIIGHSGSSCAWNLGIRQDPPIAAYVSDLVTDYYNIIGNQLVDETIPALYPHHPAINDFSEVPLPVLEVDYGYEKEFDEILDFFDQHL